MFDDFTQSINQYWTQTSTGGGKLRIVDSALRMEFPSAQSEQYVDAQIDDYSRLARSAFPCAWRFVRALRYRLQSRTAQLRSRAYCAAQPVLGSGTTRFHYAETSLCCQNPFGFSTPRLHQIWRLCRMYPAGGGRHRLCTVCVSPHYQLLSPQHSRSHGRG